MIIVTEPEAANCFSTNFQMFTNNNQQTSIKSHFKFITVRKKHKAKSFSHWSVTITSETVNFGQSECRKINSYLEIYTNCKYPF